MTLHIGLILMWKPSEADLESQLMWEMTPGKHQWEEGWQAETWEERGELSASQGELSSELPLRERDLCPQKPLGVMAEHTSQRPTSGRGSWGVEYATSCQTSRTTPRVVTIPEHSGLSHGWAKSALAARSGSCPLKGSDWEDVGE